jgi:hypothetical protein
VEGLTAEVVDVQESKLASQGAEEVFVQGFRERGAKLTNIDEPSSYKNSERTQRSLLLSAHPALVFLRISFSRR